MRIIYLISVNDIFGKHFFYLIPFIITLSHFLTLSHLFHTHSYPISCICDESNAEGYGSYFYFPYLLFFIFCTFIIVLFFASHTYFFYIFAGIWQKGVLHFLNMNKKQWISMDTLNKNMYWLKISFSIFRSKRLLFLFYIRLKLTDIWKN